MTPDHSHDPNASTWVPRADTHPDFPVQNLPLGVFSVAGGEKRIGTAIGEFVLDLTPLSEATPLPTTVNSALREPRLNSLFALPAPHRTALRHALFALLTDGRHRSNVGPYLHRAKDVSLHLPVDVGDYTDFYVGIHHATNVGKLFRPDSPLLPNYKYVPIGYHGRASSVRASGAPVLRPHGQIKANDAVEPTLQASQRLDYELELGIWVAGENSLGEPVPIQSASDRIAGLCLLNDWSTRDIQAWEYQPLGPFVSKNFLTTISPWVITADALVPFRTAQAQRPVGDPAPLPYLWDETDQSTGAFSVGLEVSLSSAAMREAGHAPLLLSQGPASNMYWTVAQMIAHHTVGGCNLSAGDLLGTGTLSGPDRESFGSLIEISRGGKDPIDLPTGEIRVFLEDGDEVTFTAVASLAGWRTIGFGPCVGRVQSSQ